MAFSIIGALTGCMSSMFCVEGLAKEQPSSMNLLTFSTFLFISLEGFIFTSKFLTVKNKIPLTYLPVVITFFLCNVINNQALNYHVPVPLHIIFRSGSLFTSLLMNRFILKRYYSTKKYLSILAITIGIIICTFATSNNNKSPFNDVDKYYNEWLIGILMLIIALLISSYMSICQERLYLVNGKHPREAMFYIHLISLPFFVFVGSDIWKNIVEFNNGPSIKLYEIEILPSVSSLWFKLLGACFGQWLCILFVYRLTAEVDSLTVTLVVTLRKFLSLIISIFWFNNAFTALHWLGAILVFGGTLVFSDVFSQNKQINLVKKQETKKKN